jgi:peptidoglycan hydrolase-like protein with peptidoglycan-binding domain
MKKLTTAACALALGIAWAGAPAIAQDTTKEKAEQKAQQIEQKGEQKAGETKAKAEEKADKVRAKAAEKTDGTKDTVGDKMDRAWDKTKAKTKEVKDKVTGKVEKMTNGHAKDDVRAAQQALRDKGFNPGPIDGVMGPRTTAAVKDFQQKENLTVTGSLDAETNSRLMAAAPPAASPSAEPKDSTKKQTQ